MYELQFTGKAIRQLEKLQKPVQERILSTLKRIKVRPYHFVQRLVGSPFYRLRVGEYRVILDIIDNKLIVFVIEVGHRRNIYK